MIGKGNPVLELQAVAALRQLPWDTRRVIEILLLDLARDARDRARTERRWPKPAAWLYWQSVAIYARHIARAPR